MLSIAARCQVMEKPRCQYKGTPPHPATHMLVWFLHSGIQIKWSCAEHRLKFGSHHGHWITEVLGWWAND
jgi:hypothetical protein